MKDMMTTAHIVALLLEASQVLALLCDFASVGIYLYLKHKLADVACIAGIQVHFSHRHTSLCCLHNTVISKYILISKTILQAWL